MTAPGPNNILDELNNDGDAWTIFAGMANALRTGHLRVIITRVLSDLSRGRAVGTFHGRLGDLNKAVFGPRDDWTRTHYLCELMDQKLDRIAKQLKVDVSDLEA